MRIFVYGLVFITANWANAACFTKATAKGNYQRRLGRHRSMKDSKAFVSEWFPLSPNVKEKHHKVWDWVSKGHLIPHSWRYGLVFKGYNYLSGHKRYSMIPPILARVCKDICQNLEWLTKHPIHTCWTKKSITKQNSYRERFIRLIPTIS